MNAPKMRDDAQSTSRVAAVQGDGVARRFRRPAFLGWSREMLLEVLLPLGHSSHIRRHRAQVIVDRVSVIAALFAVLTPAWILIDLLVFPLRVGILLATLRLLSGLGFTGIALLRTRRRDMEFAYLMLAGLLAIPPAFFLLAYPTLSALPPDPVTEVFVAAYAELPMIAVAGLAVFPLTAMEVACASLPILLLSLFSLLSSPAPIAASTVVISLWHMMLIGGVSCIAGMSQLQYMIRLVNQASHDVLTGAFTRRSGQENLDLQFRISARMDTPLAVAFVDVDNFKAVNDGFGHEVGDALLRQVSAALKAILRQSDMLVRWGGEEFVLILPNTAPEGVNAILERLGGAGLGKRPDGQAITVSIGIAERMIDGIGDPEALVQRADERMYQAKQAGKNRCIGPSAAASRARLIAPPME